MDEAGPMLSLGTSADGFSASALTNTDGSHALLIRDAERPRALVTVGTDARAGRVIVTPLDDGVELRKDREAAAQWIAAGSIVPEGRSAPPVRQVPEHAQAHVPAWANVIGLALVLFILALTILGALTLVGWLTRLVGG